MPGPCPAAATIPRQTKQSDWRKSTTVSSQHRQPDAGNAHPHDGKDNALSKCVATLKWLVVPRAACMSISAISIAQAYGQDNVERARDTRPDAWSMQTEGKAPGSDHGREGEFCRLKPCRRPGDHAAVHNQTRKAKHQVSCHDEPQHGQARALQRDPAATSLVHRRRVAIA